MRDNLATGRKPNPFGLFLQERVVPKFGAWLPFADIYAAYSEYARQNGHASMSEKAVSGMLSSYGYEHNRRSIGSGFADIALADVPQERCADEVVRDVAPVALDFAAYLLAEFVRERGEWEGIVSELHGQLEHFAVCRGIDMRDEHFPVDAARLSRHINNVRLSLEAVGIKVRNRRSRDGAVIVLRNARAGRVAPAREEAEDFLRGVLADGKVKAEDVKRMALEHGIASATLRLARENVGITCSKGRGEDMTWYWSLLNIDHDRTIVPDQTIKADAGKLRLSLVPSQVIRDIAEVREYGNRKYGDSESWRRVDRKRYVDALYRHMLAFVDDPASKDEESGIEHYKHLACNIAFLCEMMKDGAGYLACAGEIAGGGE